MASRLKGIVIHSRSATRVGTGHPVGQRGAEIAREDAADPGEVARERGPVEAELLAQSRERVLPGRGAEHDRGGIARQHLEHQEDRGRDRKQRQGERGEAGQNEAEQRGSMSGGVLMANLSSDRGP
jgi:hypothetical protein